MYRPDFDVAVIYIRGGGALFSKQRKKVRHTPFFREEVPAQ